MNGGGGFLEKCTKGEEVLVKICLFVGRGWGANGETAKLKNILIKKLQQHYH